MPDWARLERLLQRAPGDWSAFVHARGEELYAFAADRVVPAASLIKVPLAMAVIAASHGLLDDREPLDLDTVVVLREEDRVDGEGAFDAAPAGTRRTRRELIGHMLRESDNTAGNLLAAAVGIDAANHFFRAPPLALARTSLRRRFMDLAAARAGCENLTTAREMGRIFSVLLADRARYGALLDWLATSPYDERIVAGVPAGTVVAHKVGDLAGIEHDAGIVYAPNGPYIVVLLSSNLPEAAWGGPTMAEASRLIYTSVVW
jgi:beta-lactamase class A